jgi:hypothetical protein
MVGWRDLAGEGEAMECGRLLPLIASQSLGPP